MSFYFTHKIIVTQVILLSDGQVDTSSPTFETTGYYAEQEGYNYSPTLKEESYNGCVYFTSYDIQIKKGDTVTVFDGEDLLFEDVEVQEVSRNSQIKIGKVAYL